MEVSRLAVVAVLFVRPVWAFLLIVAALRRWVAQVRAALTRELAIWAHGARFLVTAGWAVPVTVAALALRVAALITATGSLARKAVTFDLEDGRVQCRHVVSTKQLLLLE